MGSNLSAIAAPQRTLEAFIEHSQRLRWSALPQATRTMVKCESPD
jgi:hypothetical protein